MRRTARPASYLIFPVTLAAALAAAVLAQKSGVPPPAVLGLAAGGCVLVVALAERWIPFRPDWNLSRGDVRTDIIHNIVSSFGGREVFKLAFTAALLPLVAWLARSYGAPLWPTGWPLSTQVLLAAAIAELGQYAAHRLAHERELFWRIHATHHSPERLYWLNAGRDHPLGALWLFVGTAVPLIALGVPLQALTLFYVLEGVLGLFQHANIDVRLGPLNWVFSMAELHRWHHSKLTREANHNYGATLILWDVVFGTRFLPEGRAAPDAIGIADLPGFPQGYLGQLAVPFRWTRLKAGTPAAQGALAVAGR